MDTKQERASSSTQIYNFYKQRIDGTAFRTVKRYYQTPRQAGQLGGPIQEIILVHADEDLARIAALLHIESTAERSARGLELAQAGKIRFAVEQVQAVPYPWNLFAVAFRNLDEQALCDVIYAPPAYLVQFM